MEDNPSPRAQWTSCVGWPFGTTRCTHPLCVQTSRGKRGRTHRVFLGYTRLKHLGSKRRLRENPGSPVPANPLCGLGPDPNHAPSGGTYLPGESSNDLWRGWGGGVDEVTLAVGLGEASMWSENWRQGGTAPSEWPTMDSDRSPTEEKEQLFRQASDWNVASSSGGGGGGGGGPLFKLRLGFACRFDLWGIVVDWALGTKRIPGQHSWTCRCPRCPGMRLSWCLGLEIRIQLEYAPTSHPLLGEDNNSPGGQ